MLCGVIASGILTIFDGGIYSIFRNIRLKIKNEYCYYCVKIIKYYP